MKVEARVMDVTTTLEGEKVGMTIDQGALAHIMSVLTDLYSDPEMAVIREYSTNAFDAHVEAGVTRPIEITTPTSLAPFFRVRDYGTGLDADDIRDIYSRYGASTKRESNDVVGMLGLGCKSALTYTDQFTLTGIKNGVCTQVSISRDEDGGGSMTIVSQYETDDPSGVEIIVPAQRTNYFDTKSRKFFRFWDKGTVLVNGEEPNRIDGMWIADDILLTKELDRSVVVMGNVAYPTSEHEYARWKTVSFVKIGEVNFTPSREALQMTAKTKTTLANLKERIKRERNDALQKLVDEAKTPYEAVAVALKATDIVENNNFKPTYKGVEIPTVITAGKDKSLLIVDGQKRYRHKGHHRNSQVYMSNAINAMWLVGFTGDSFSAYKRQKLDQWMEQTNITAPNYFILVDKIPADTKPWIDKSRVFEWADVDAQKIVRQRAARQDGRPSGCYEGYIDGKYSSKIQAADIDTSKPLFFWNRTTHGDYGVPQVRALHPDATILSISSNRIAKFQRDFPMAKPVRTYLTEAAKTWENTLADDQRQYIIMNENSSSQLLKHLDAARIDDPDVKSAVSIYNNSSLKNAYQSYLKIYSRFIEMNLTWESPLDKYVLLTSIDTYGTMNNKMKNDLYIYMNAAYAAGQEAS